MSHANITSSTSGKSSGSTVSEMVCRLALVMNWRLPEVGRISAEGSPPRYREEESESKGQEKKR